MATHFTPETMRFLRGLARNNDRSWFEERRPVYERALRAPLLAVVEEISAELGEFAPEYVRPPQKVAMRIFRDTRFSPDKRPYKTHLAAWWARRGLEKSSGAGFYLQVGTGEILLAGGVYAPDRMALLALRRWLAEHHERYRAAAKPLLQPRRGAPAMQPIAADPLTRNPKGFPPEHPASDLLRVRNLGLMLSLPAEVALGPGFPALVCAQMRRLTSVVELLNEPLTASSPHR